MQAEGIITSNQEWARNGGGGKNKVVETPFPPAGGPRAAGCDCTCVCIYESVGLCRWSNLSNQW